MGINEHFHCEECLIKMVCTGLCDSVKSIENKQIDRRLNNNICPDCGNHISNPKLFIMSGKVDISYMVCKRCKHSFKIILDKTITFIERGLHDRNLQ